MRIIVADDTALVREGLAAILRSCGHDVIESVGDAPRLLAAVNARRDDLPDVVVTDVRMPPRMTDDGLRAAVELRRRFPGLAVMVLSAYVAESYLSALLVDAGATGGVGYLLKERVGRVSDFVSSLDVVAGGGTVVDPEVVRHLMSAGRGSGRLGRLSERENAVLALMAGGLSNTRIAEQLCLSGAGVAKHVANVFAKLDLPPGEDNRRVRAVLLWLEHQG